MSIPAALRVSYEATRLDLPTVEANRPRFVLSAQRPLGDPLTAEENLRRHHLLGAHLAWADIPAEEVTAHEPDGTTEQCWGITCTVEQVVDLCRFFEQHGYFEVTLASYRFVEV